MLVDLRTFKIKKAGECHCMHNHSHSILPTTAQPGKLWSSQISGKQPSPAPPLPPSGSICNPQHQGRFPPRRWRPSAGATEVRLMPTAGRPHARPLGRLVPVRAASIPSGLPHIRRKTAIPGRVASDRWDGCRCRWRCGRGRLRAAASPFCYHPADAGRCKWPMPASMPVVAGRRVRRPASRARCGGRWLASVAGVTTDSPDGLLSRRGISGVAGLLPCARLPCRIWGKCRPAACAGSHRAAGFAP
jgi:hypothetical protein